MTIDEVLARAAAALDEIHRDGLEDSIARMVSDHCTDEAIEEFERLSYEEFDAWRADTLADLRTKLRQMMH